VHHASSIVSGESGGHAGLEFEWSSLGHAPFNPIHGRRHPTNRQGHFVCPNRLSGWAGGAIQVEPPYGDAAQFPGSQDDRVAPQPPPHRTAVVAPAALAYQHGWGRPTVLASGVRSFPCGLGQRVTDDHRRAARPSDHRHVASEFRNSPAPTIARPWDDPLDGENVPDVTQPMRIPHPRRNLRTGDKRAPSDDRHAESRGLVGTATTPEPSSVTIVRRRPRRGPSASRQREFVPSAGGASFSLPVEGSFRPSHRRPRTTTSPPRPGKGVPYSRTIATGTATGTAQREDCKAEATGPESAIGGGGAASRRERRTMVS
jgi:hypothetical protein